MPKGSPAKQVFVYVVSVPCLVVGAHVFRGDVFVICMYICVPGFLSCGVASYNRNPFRIPMRAGILGPLPFELCSYMWVQFSGQPQTEGLSLLVEFSAS